MALKGKIFVLGDQAWGTYDTRGNIFVLGEQAWGTDDTKGHHVCIRRAGLGYR
jgi:hypothetical protein